MTAFSVFRVEFNHSYTPVCNCPQVPLGIFIVHLWTSNIAVRALAYCAKDPRFETHLEPRAGHSLTVHPAANGDLVETLGR